MGKKYEIHGPETARFVPTIHASFWCGFKMAGDMQIAGRQPQSMVFLAADPGRQEDMQSQFLSVMSIEYETPL